MPSANNETSRLSNKELLLPYAAPYVTYVAAGSFLGPYLEIEYVYAVRFLAVVLLLFWAWPRYASVTGGKGRGAVGISAAVGLVAGVAGAVVWAFLRKPFASETVSWSQSEFALKLLIAGLLVPVIEELLMRCYVFRLVLQWESLRKSGADDPFDKAFAEKSIHDVEPGAWSISAVVVSTVVFALGHSMPQWPAAIVYGLIMAGLWIVRKDLLSCIVAHSATNVGLAIYIYVYNDWGLW